MSVKSRVLISGILYAVIVGLFSLLGAFHIISNAIAFGIEIAAITVFVSYLQQLLRKK